MIPFIFAISTDNKVYHFQLTFNYLLLLLFSSHCNLKFFSKYFSIINSIYLRQQYLFSKRGKEMTEITIVKVHSKPFHLFETTKELTMNCLNVTRFTPISFTRYYKTFYVSNFIKFIIWWSVWPIDMAPQNRWPQMGIKLCF